MKRCLTAWILAMLVAVTAVLSQEPDTYFKTYGLKTSDAKVLVDALTELIGDKGRVFFLKQNNEVIVSTTSNLHAQVTMLLKEVDRAASNVMIVVTSRSRGAQNSAGAGVRDIGGDVVIGPGGTRVKVRGKPQVKWQNTQQKSLNSQKLMVRSGTEGTFFVGQDVPFVKWLTQVGLQWGNVSGVAPRLEEPEIEWRSVGASLRIKPVVIGNGPLVSVEVTPELSGLVKDPEGRLDRRMRRIRYSKVSSKVTVQHGKTVSLGGLVKNREFYERFLVGLDANGSRQSLDISLTAYILDEKGSEGKSTEANR